MKVKEFIEKHSDVILAPFTQEEFKNLTEGSVIFFMAAAWGSTAGKPVDERAVRLDAGYQLVVAKTYDEDTGDLSYITTVGLTAGGYAKCEYISPDEVFSDNTAVKKLIFHCKPPGPNDPRGNQNWFGKKKVNSTC